MKTYATLAAMALGLAVTSGAFAQMGPMGDPYGDATVSRADAQKRGAEMFAMLDANKDGAITEDDMGPMGRMISRLDTDGNGKVTTEEFTEMQLRRFDRMDENHDGQLTKAERDAAMAAMRERMGGGTPPPQ